jgi:2-desacetyl-2-hydroxyethyl bacteriochlorophyllide A dehydrogenase
MQTRALLFTAPDTVEIGTITLPPPGADEVLIRTAYSGVSTGTELRCLAGKLAGMSPWPVVPGYQASGHIIARGSAVSLPEGTPVYFTGSQKMEGSGRLWGGHLAHAIVAERDVVPLAPGANLPDAALAHIVAIARHGALAGAVRAGEAVVVIGLGPIGLLSARIHALLGARVWAFDLLPERVARARASGLAAFSSREELAHALRHEAPGGVDIAVDSTGVPAVLTQALALLRDVPWGETAAERPRPRLVVQGSYAADALPSLPYHELFGREATVIVPRDCHADDILAALDLLASQQLYVRDLYGSALPIAQAPAVYASLRDRTTDIPSAVFAW